MMGFESVADRNALRIARHALTDWTFRAAMLVLLASLILAPFMPGIIPPIWAAVAMALPWFWARQERLRRFFRLHAQSNKAAGEMTGPNFAQSAQARLAQAQRAVADDTPFFEFGRATGVLASRWDPFAPDRGLPVGMTANDLSQHVVVFGGTGTGKTSAVIRPLLVWWLNHKVGGAFVMDGKAALPKEMSGAPRYRVLDPKDASCVVSLFAGLAPHDVTNALAALHVTEDSKASSGGKFFEGNAQSLLLHACVVLDALVQMSVAWNATHPSELTEPWSWTVMGLRRVLDVAASHPADGQPHPLMAMIDWVIDAATSCNLPQFADTDNGATWAQAVAFFGTLWMGLGDKTRGDVMGTLNPWIDPLVQHPDLVRWARATDGVDITTALHGDAYGLFLPEVEYGAAGRAVSALLRSRLYKALRSRGDLKAAQAQDATQSRVLICIDEAQDMMTSMETKLLAVARSLGGCFLIASQGVKSLENSLNATATATLLTNFRNIICLKADHYTYAIIQAIGGKTTFRITSMQTSDIAWCDDIAMALSGAAFDPGHPMRDAAHRWRARLPMPTVNGQLYGSRASARWEVDHLLPLDLLANTLEQPNTAIAILQRAGVTRRDFVRLEPQYAADQPREMIQATPDNDAWWRDDLAQLRFDIENAAKTAAPVAPAPAPVAAAPATPPPAPDTAAVATDEAP